MKISLIILILFTKSSFAQTTSYQYDKLYRLTKISYSNGSSISYAYDANGNRVSQVNNLTALPVKLLTFTATTQNCNTISLIWQTAQENNNRGFDVQQSVGGINFSPVAFVKSSGNSETEQRYLYNIVNANDGVYYFRLKQTDLDGKFTYSKIITVKVDCSKNAIALTPNPASTQVTIAGLDNTKAHSIQIFDSKGVLVKTIGKLNTNSIDISLLAHGLYLLKIDNKESLKLIKQ